jgi:hypothetical protein
MQDRKPDRRNFLRRTAGPYIRVNRAIGAMSVTRLLRPRNRKRYLGQGDSHVDQRGNLCTKIASSLNHHGRVPLRKLPMRIVSLS